MESTTQSADTSSPSKQQHIGGELQWRLRHLGFDKLTQLGVIRLLFETVSLLQRERKLQQLLAEDQSQLMRTPDVLKSLAAAKADNMYNILRMAGEQYAEVIAILQDPVCVAELVHSAPSAHDVPEWEAGSSSPERDWRRIIRLAAPVRLGHVSSMAVHDLPTRTGEQDLHNALNKRTGEEGLSYYQKQQLRYGKGRKGSTSIAGAWEEVFAQVSAATASGAASVAPASPLPSAVPGTGTPGSGPRSAGRSPSGPGSATGSVGGASSMRTPPRAGLRSSIHTGSSTARGINNPGQAVGSKFASSANVVLSPALAKLLEQAASAAIPDKPTEALPQPAGAHSGRKKSQVSASASVRGAGTTSSSVAGQAEGPRRKSLATWQSVYSDGQPGGSGVGNTSPRASVRQVSPRSPRTGLWSGWAVPEAAGSSSRLEVEPPVAGQQTGHPGQAFSNVQPAEISSAAQRPRREASPSPTTTAGASEGSPTPRDAVARSQVIQQSILQVSGEMRVDRGKENGDVASTAADDGVDKQSEGQPSGQEVHDGAQPPE